jgi:serine/threonine protein kinase
LNEFETSKIINSNRTKTIIGTPKYMAPEVITGEGYSFSIDYWSIGICAYEFLYGGVPFGEGDSDPMLVYKKILYE